MTAHQLQIGSHTNLLATRWIDWSYSALQERLSRVFVRIFPVVSLQYGGHLVMVHAQTVFGKRVWETRLYEVASMVKILRRSTPTKVPSTRT